MTRTENGQGYMTRLRGNSNAARVLNDEDFDRLQGLIDSLNIPSARHTQASSEPSESSTLDFSQDTTN